MALRRPEAPQAQIPVSLSKDNKLLARTPPRLEDGLNQEQDQVFGFRVQDVPRAKFGPAVRSAFWGFRV